MKTNERDTELIEQYIDGELQGSNLQIFEERLKKEPELAKAYKLRLKFAGLWNETSEYEKTRGEIAAALHAEQSSFFLRNKTYIISIAASVAILLGIYLLFFQNKNNLNNGQQLVVSDTVNNKEQVIQFHMDEPEKLADIDTLNDSIKLLFPVNNIILTIKSPVVFKWRSFSAKTDTLYLFNTSEGLLIKKQIIYQNNDTNTFKLEQLDPGTYVWHFSDTTNKGAFSIVNNK